MLQNHTWVSNLGSSIYSIINDPLQLISFLDRKLTLLEYFFCLCYRVIAKNIFGFCDRKKINFVIKFAIFSFTVSLYHSTFVSDYHRLVMFVC